MHVGSASDAGDDRVAQHPQVAHGCVQYTAAMPFDVVGGSDLPTRALSADYNVLALAAPDIAAAAAPGQFVMVKAGGGHDPLLRRPFSVFEMLRDAAGDADRLLAAQQAHRPVDAPAVRGATRRSRRLPRPARAGRSRSSSRRAEAWMVAGGVGLAPFATLAGALAPRGVADDAVLRRAARATSCSTSTAFRDLGVDAGADDRRRQPRRARPRHRAARARSWRRGPPTRRVMLYACGPEGDAGGRRERSPRAHGGPARCRSSASWAAAWAAATAASCRCATATAPSITCARASPARCSTRDRDRLGLADAWTFPFASAR